MSKKELRSNGKLRRSGFVNGAAEREEMLSVLLSLRKSSMFDFEGTNSAEMAQWLSWLERRPVTAKVVGSSPIWVVTIRDFWLCHKWGLSSAGRASALQAEGHRFEPYRPHLLQ